MWYLVALLVVLSAHEALADPPCNDPNAVEYYDTNLTDPTVLSYTKPSGSNQVTFIGVGQRTGTAPRTFTITHGNGDTITEITTPTYVDPIGARLFDIINISSGAHNITVNWSPSAPLDASIQIFTCSNADTASFRSTNQGSGTGTGPSVTAPTVQAGDTVIDFLVSESIITPTVGANQTVIKSGAAGSISSGASFQAGANGGVMSWSTNNNDWGLHVVVVKPVAGGGGRIRDKPMVFP